jgi:Cytochrome c
VVRRRRPLVLIALGAVLAAACTREPDADAPADPRPAALERLRAFESARRDGTDFRTLPASDTVLGPDPVAVARLPGSARLVGLLRGRSAVVLLDGDLHEVARLDAPAAPSALAIAPSGDVFVSGELADAIGRYVADGAGLRAAGAIPLPGVRAVRGIAVGPEGVLYAVEDHDHRLLTIPLRDGEARPDAVSVGLGPRSVLRTPRHVVVDCILSHEIVVLPVDARGRPREIDAIRIRHDGPIWAVGAQETADGLLLALGGVEDRPLDRRQGSFGYIDSFAWVYRVSGAPPAARRLAAVNVSALGLVTPKVIAVRADGDDVSVRLTGYGDATALTLRWTAPQPGRTGLWPAPAVEARALVPGTVAEASLDDGRRVLADPLLDAWVVDDGADARVVPVPDTEARSVASRVGEALFFTTLMAPWNRTHGSLSRFTCETCHFEGAVDGRVHDTGRGVVHVATRPLLGLLNDPPYFSRALDPDLTAMTHNEFRVAGLRSRHDPWFALDRARVPWLGNLGVGEEMLGPEDLRRAFMTFLMDFTPRENPAVVGRSTWSREERRGAEAFLARCEACHQARLVTNRPGSRVPFADWERLVMTPEDPLVWANPDYAQTGVVPYVHERGSRVPSLRRLYRKHPYFTNGSAATLDDVLARARFAPAGFQHDGGEDGAARGLDDDERRALLAFLDLL